MIIEQLGLVLLFIPMALAKSCRTAGIYAIGVGVFLAGLYYAFLKRFFKSIQSDYVSFIRRTTGKGGEILIGSIYVLSCLLGSGWILYQMTVLVNTRLLEGWNFTLLSLLGAGLLWYNLRGSYEANRRVFSILFYFLLIPLVLAVLCNFSRIDWGLLKPVTLTRQLSLDQGILMVFGSSIAFFLLPFHYNPRKVKLGWGLLVEGIILLAVFLVSESVFGIEGLAKTQWSTLYLASTGTFPWGGSIRLEPLLSGSMYLWMFSSLSLLGFTGKKIVKETYHIRKQKPEELWNLTWVVLVWLAAKAFALFPVLRQQAENVYWWAGAALLALLPLLLYFLSKIKKTGGKKKMAAAMLLALTLVLNGCQAEVEDKLFITVIGVGKESISLITPVLSEATGDNKGDSQNQTVVIPAGEWNGISHIKGNYTDKSPETSHLKAITLSKEITGNLKAMDRICRDLKGFPEVSWSTFLFSIEEEEIGEMAEADRVGGDLGTYLEDMVEGRKKGGEGEPITIRDLIYAWQNDEKFPEIPEITIKEGRPGFV